MRINQGKVCQELDENNLTKHANCTWHGIVDRKDYRKPGFGQLKEWDSARSNFEHHSRLYCLLEFVCIFLSFACLPSETFGLGNSCDQNMSHLLFGSSRQQRARVWLRTIPNLPLNWAPSNWALQSSQILLSGLVVCARGMSSRHHCARVKALVR